MKAERVRKVFNLDVSQLEFQPHRSGVYEFAIVGDYVVYHEIEKDDYDITLDNAIVTWAVDLGKEI